MACKLLILKFIIMKRKYFCSSNGSCSSNCVYMNLLQGNSAVMLPDAIAIMAQAQSEANTDQTQIILVKPSQNNN